MPTPESAALAWRSDFEQRIHSGAFPTVSALRAQVLESRGVIEREGVGRDGKGFFSVVLPAGRRLRLRFVRTNASVVSSVEAYAPIWSRVVFDGYAYAIKFRFVERARSALGEVCRQYGGVCLRDEGHPLRWYWRFSRRTLDNFCTDLFDDLVDLFCAAGTPVSDDVESFRSALAEAMGDVETGRRLLAYGHLLMLYPVDAGAASVVMGGFHPGVPSVAREMKGVFFPAMKAWRIRSTAVLLKERLEDALGLSGHQVVVMPGEYLFSEASGLQQTDRPCVSAGDTCAPVVFDAGPEDESGRESGVYLAAAAPLRPTEFPAQWIEEQIAAYSLYADYQPAGVRHLVTKTSALLADDMGLGKTRQAIVAADIISRAVRRDTGRAVVLVVCPAGLVVNWSREIAAVDAQARISMQGFDEEASWVVIGYSRLEEVLPYAERFVVMLVDEAHFLKEVSSQRTRAAFDVGANIAYRYLLTATPILNREGEIHSLLRLSGHPLGDVPLREFEKQYAGNPAFRRELKHRVGEWMLRRTKDGVLRHLKGKQRQVVYLGGDAVARARYNAVARDGSLQPLQKINKLRRILEEIKIDLILGTLLDLGGDDKAIVFCEFTQTVADLKNRLAQAGFKSATLVGGDGLTRRQRSVDAFQDDPEVRFFLTTTAAGGVGWNLTAANYVFFASLPWTGALKNQAEDRAYRNGQLRMVVVKIPLMEGTIDDALWELLRYKETLAAEIMDESGDVLQMEKTAREEFALRLAA